MNISAPEHEFVYCTHCGKAIEDGNYFMVGDNFLQSEYLEKDNNKFCSKDCLCRFLTVMEVTDFNEDNAFII